MILKVIQKVAGLLTICSITLCGKQQHQQRIDNLEKIVSQQYHQIRTIETQLVKLKQR